jgi:sec-independent protein translocase protein TatC
MRRKRTSSGSEMPFTAHLGELRGTLIRSLIAAAVGFGACYGFSEQLLVFVWRPVGRELVFIAPTEAFFAHLKVAFLAGLVLSWPYICYQVWSFVVPGLYAHERRYTLPFVLGATAMFLLGGVFVYTLILPYGMAFLLGYGSAILVPMISVGAYVSFALRLFIAFGVVFELPLVVVLLSKLGLVTPQALARNRKYVIVLSFLVAAVLTPPDVFTQVLMALPMLVLFEISILLARWTAPRGGVVEVEDDVPAAAGR